MVGEAEGGDRAALLLQRRQLRKRLRKAETSLWSKKEEECKKGKKKLGSKLITCKEDYLKALVEKGIRRELRRSESIREYWERQSSKLQDSQELGLLQLQDNQPKVDQESTLFQLEENPDAVPATEPHLADHSDLVEQQIVSLPKVKEQTIVLLEERLISLVQQEHLGLAEDQALVLLDNVEEDLLQLEEEDLLQLEEENLLQLEEKERLVQSEVQEQDLLQLEELVQLQKVQELYLPRLQEVQNRDVLKLDPQKLVRLKEVQKQDQLHQLKEVQELVQVKEAIEASKLERESTAILEVRHLLEPLPSSPSLPPGEAASLLVLGEVQEGVEVQGLRRRLLGHPGMLRAGLCLRRLQAAVSSCLTCLVQCLGPV